MTTYLAGTRSDAIRVLYSGSELQALSVAGAVPGVTPLAAGGANGPGVGTLRQNADATLQWKAPGSSIYGAAVTIPGDGSYVLEDGTDAGAYLRVQVSVAFQAGAAAGAEVRLQDRFNELGPDDVTSGEASAGDVSSWSVTLENQSGCGLEGLTVYIDPAVSGLEVSDDNATWVSPTTLGGALSLAATLAAGGTVTLYLRRTIVAGASSDPDVLNHLHINWTGL